MEEIGDEESWIFGYFLSVYRVHLGNGCCLAQFFFGRSRPTESISSRVN
jgi:hypothetical protein